MTSTSASSSITTKSTSTCNNTSTIVNTITKTTTSTKASKQCFQYYDKEGVRQGDPLLPLLFNRVINQALEEALVVWRRRGYGTALGQYLRVERLTHVAFADDVTLVSRDWLPMKRMLSKLRKSLAAQGLTLHPSKYNLQTNSVEWKRRRDVVVEDGLSV